VVPKRKRAKRRNRRHGSSGYVLYGWFKYLETQNYWNNVTHHPVRTTMIGGIVIHG
jgi:hypothetical protein